MKTNVYAMIIKRPLVARECVISIGDVVIFRITPTGGSPVGISEGAKLGERNDIVAGSRVKNCCSFCRRGIWLRSHFELGTLNVQVYLRSGQIWTCVGIEANLLLGMFAAKLQADHRGTNCILYEGANSGSEQLKELLGKVGDERGSCT
jgi:hypothetical protein